MPHQGGGHKPASPGQRPAPAPRPPQSRGNTSNPKFNEHGQRQGPRHVTINQPGKKYGRDNKGHYKGPAGPKGW
jgi:hypothetical protein